MSLIRLNLEQPEMRADYESNAPTGGSVSDIASMEQFFIGVQTNSGQIVTPEKAKRCATVLACIRGISEDLSALPMELYRRGKNGDELATDHTIHPLLDVSPNDVMTPMELRERIVFDLMLHGNFYVLKSESVAPGVISSLWPLQANYVTRQSLELVWNFTDPLTGISGSFTPDLVWRGTMLSGNGVDGVALTLLAREAIGLLLAAEQQAARLFSYGVQTDLTLSTPETLDDESKQQLRDSFMRRHAGSDKAWTPLLLEGGLTASRIGLTAQESQYMEARSYQVAEIARIFRYPEVLLGSVGKSSKASTYASAEQFFQSYTKHCLTPWAVRIEQTAQRDLLTKKEQANYFIRHNFESLLRGDTAARYASYTQGIASGFMSPADARRKENMTYVPGLDYYTRPANTATTAGEDAQAADTANPADNQDALAGRVALFLIRKEEKALAAKQDPGVFYVQYAKFVEDMTGASLASSLAYVEMRKALTERFSAEARVEALNALITLCKKGN